MTLRKANLGTGCIIGLFPELLGIGGVQEAGRLTAAALQGIAAERGWSVNFLTLNDPRGPHSLGVVGRAISLDGFGRAKVPFALSGLRRARSDAKNGGVVLAAHPNLGVPARWMQRGNPRLKTVVMSHGIEVWEPMPAFRRRALVRANLVLAPSRDTARKLVEVQGVSPEKVRKLAWPLHPSFLRMADLPAKLPLPAFFPEGRVILTVGRWAASERYKGADELMSAFAQLRPEIPGWHLVAVGGGDDLPRLKQLAGNLGITDCVRFLENLSREEIAACYARADFFALASTGEGFGLVFLEAMAFSKAVVGLACGGTTDVVEDGINGLLVSPRDPAALAKALGQLLKNESLRVQLGRRGGEIVRQRYQFDAFRTGMEQILAECGLRGEVPTSCTGA